MLACCKLDTYAMEKIERNIKMNNIELVKNKIKNLDSDNILEENIMDNVDKYRINDFLDKNSTKFNDIPNEPGIYFILKLDNDEIKFNKKSDAKFATGKEYKDIDKIYEKYNRGDKTIIYIGKADGKKGRDKGLRQRLKQFFRQYKSHSGGRLIWQIENNKNLGVKWITLENIKDCKNPETFEKYLLKNYNEKYNLNQNKNKDKVRPIANHRF